jgi:hypothetical protein
MFEVDDEPIRPTSGGKYQPRTCLMEEIRNRVIARLGDADNPILEEGVEMAVDHALAQKVNQLVDPDDAVDLIVDLVAGDNVTRLTERHLNPARKRLREHFRETEETPNDLTPEDTLERLESILRNGDYPRAKWASGAIKREHVRTLLAPVIQEVLLAFTSKLPIPGSDSDGGSSKKKRGFGFGSSIMDIGKGMLGDLRERFQAVAREFSSQAMSDARDAAVAQLTSEEGQQTLRDMRDALVQRFMETQVIEFLDDLERLPLENLLDIAPDIADHNRTREEFRTFVRGEVEALLYVEGDRPIQELLEENGLLEQVRSTIIEQAKRQTAELFQEDAAAAWLDKLLAE